MTQLKDTYPLYLAGEPISPNTDLEVPDRHTGETAFRVPLVGPDGIERAIAAAEGAAPATAAVPAYRRAEVLTGCVERFKERFDELAMALCVEAGKPIVDSEGEVTRLIETFSVAAGEATRVGGEVIEMEISRRTEGYRAMTKRVPIGPCAFITPFNFPLNLVAHKVAPAIACGCPFVLKPADKTPVGALIMAEIIAEASAEVGSDMGTGTALPQGSFSVICCDVEHAGPLTSDQRLRLLSFTGSDIVGKKLASQAGIKRIVLELGGNAACVVDEGVDLDECAGRIIHGGYYQSGQSCVSVQRIIAHERIYDGLRDRLRAGVAELKSGDPKDRGVKIGPMIDEAAAERVESWIAEATGAEARVLAGGTRKGAMMEATLIENVPRDAKLCREEIFGPVTVLSKFSSYVDALAEVNDSRFGLQAGVFTNDLRRAHKAWDTLDVGGVIINDVPSFRADHMPYGGVKQSGLGREGVRYAIADMTEERLMVIRE